MGNTYLSIPLNATILAQGAAYPGTSPSSTPVVDENGLPVQIFLTDYFLQNALVAVWPLVQFNIDAFPIAFDIITGFNMDTDSFQLIMPELYAHYGQKKIQLTLSSAADLPTVKLDMGLQLTLPLEIAIDVEGTQGWEPACAFQTTAYADLTILAEELNYYLQVSALTFQTLQQTSGLPVNTLNSKDALNGVISLYFPDINGLFHNTVSARLGATDSDWTAVAGSGGYGSFGLSWVPAAQLTSEIRLIHSLELDRRPSLCHYCRPSICTD